MDQSLATTVATTAPYFDRTTAIAALHAAWKAQCGRESAQRAEVLAALKTLVADARAEARHQLEADGNGRRCAEGLSLFQDELIRLVYDFTVHRVYRAENPSAAERMAVVATGGYGRGMLAPGSDIDLLFVLPYKQTAWGESVVEYMLYLLWDLGFKVGHATRTVDQCIRLARSDMTIRTATLDARFILGEPDLFEALTKRFRRDVVEGTGREFIEAKLAERDARHTRAGASRYLVEPNIKDGKGGLRDLHTLHWLASYLHPEEAVEDFVEAGVFTREEYRTFRRCEDFLWTVRCHLHFLTGRADERLSFDHQPVMAERLGYRDHAGLRAVERFMKHYFLHAKDVGDLTRIVCSVLEVKQLKTVPTLNDLFAPLTWRKRARLRKTTDFRIDNGRLNVARRDAFEQDPVNLIRLFWVAERYNVEFHPDALRLVWASYPLINDKLRRSREANDLFLKLLTSSANPEVALRRMNEAGVLGRFIPVFGRVVSMMQFNMYHHYTVDEHLIRSIGVLSDIENGRCAEDLPLSTEIMKSVENRRALFVALFIHDVAKGRDEDHCIAGARIAKKLCPRLGLTPAETETVAWLVEHHLAMSQFSQSRDLNDRKTIQDFADIVQSRERLKLLTILTAADIRAVGPGVWNGWKGQLLRTLYAETEPILAGGHTRLSQTERIRRAQHKFKIVAAELGMKDVERFVDRHYPAYWLRTNVRQQVEHSDFVAATEAEGRPVATKVATDAFKGVTELTIFAQSYPRLLALIAGSCAAAGADIVGAHVSTTRDGMALDTVHLRREFERSDDEERRGARIAQSIEKLLRGDADPTRLLAKKRERKGRITAFSVEPQVVIDNTLSDELTVIEVNGLDRPGLLYDLTRTLSDMKLDIASAHIATFGERAVDVFYVTDLVGKKIISAERQAIVRRTLQAVLNGSRSEEAGEDRVSA